jgi:hypothetical protein
MSSRGRGSWSAFRSDRRVLALVPGNDRGSVGSKAVGKPDKTPLFDLVRKQFWAPGTILRPLQSRLRTALLRINRPSIAKLQPKRRLAVRGNGAFPRTCLGQARTVASIGPGFARHPFLPAFPRLPAHRHLTHKGKHYRGALRSRSGDFSFPRSEFRTAERKVRTRSQRTESESGSRTALARFILCPTIFSCSSAAQNQEGHLRPPKCRIGRRTGFCPPNKLWS